MKHPLLLPLFTGLALVTVAGLRAPAAEKVDFAKDILPVLEGQCFKCHAEEKQKGKLRLDSREAALKGGKGGPSIVAGDAAKSELLRRVSLPKSDDDFMPTDGEPLSPAAIAKLKAWIDQGADWPSAAKAVAAAPKAPVGPVLPADFKPGSAETKAVAALAQKGIDLRPIAAGSPWREANLRLLSTNITDKEITQLKDVTSLVDLNLATTKVTDAGLANLKNLVHLQRLHLQLTAVTDAGLAQLKALPNLTYLNLYGTKVTDAGLEQLKGMKHLRALYVWQSKVTEAGAKKLKAALPNVEVSTGWDLSALPKPEEKKDAKPAAKDEKKPAAAPAKDDKKPAAAPKAAEKKAEKAAPAAEKPAEKKP
ncbi:MAG: hypothetical protein RJA22_1998 [Verrucomicrobiota bacterium]|jgi:hypothetical protein